ncbi:phospholipid scramblase 1-like [Ornithodoros turicata]|uniref:phospholipid scramblase 1-like n=1 Tax=Ornithodoros turicata TaxID=34597 RepID=UPI003139BFA4
MSRQPTTTTGATQKGPRPKMQQPTVQTGVVCPPGLEYLSVLNQLIIKQQIELLEVLAGIETANKYIACNNQGQSVYFLAEVSGFCTRCCCDANRCFDMHVYDTQNRVVMKFQRPLRCQSNYRGGCCCFLQEVEVQAPPDHTIGFVNEECSFCRPSFTINDRSGKPVIRVQGPCITQSIPCACDVIFSVLTLSGNQIGMITKQFSGALRELFTDADFFCVTFPMDLDVHAKACLVACAILIDFMFFESPRNE